MISLNCLAHLLSRIVSLPCFCLCLCLCGSAQLSGSAESVKGELELPAFVADNMVLQGQTAVIQSAIWGRSRFRKVTVRYGDQAWAAKGVPESKARNSAVWYAWAVTLSNLPRQTVGRELVIETSNDGSMVPPLSRVFTNVIVGDVWLWPCQTDPRAPKAALLERSTDLADFAAAHVTLVDGLRRFSDRVRIAELPSMLGMTNRVGVPLFRWTPGDSASLSAAASLFVVGELAASKWEAPIGVIQVPAEAFKEFMPGRTNTDWKEDGVGQVNVETLGAANRGRSEFVTAVEAIHARNLNDFKLRGIPTNDAPLPLLELNSVFLRPPAITQLISGKQFHFWPFRCAVVDVSVTNFTGPKLNSN